MMHVKRLDGRVAIVTGASRGIGRAIAELFAHEGANTVVNYNTSKKEALAIVDKIKTQGREAICVNAICPGWIMTEMIEETDPEIERKILEETALKRYGTPDEIAASALFLASDESDFITGELLIVAGGRGMH